MEGGTPFIFDQVDVPVQSQYCSAADIPSCKHLSTIQVQAHQLACECRAPRLLGIDFWRGEGEATLYPKNGQLCEHHGSWRVDSTSGYFCRPFRPWSTPLDFSLREGKWQPCRGLLVIARVTLYKTCILRSAQLTHLNFTITTYLYSNFLYLTIFKSCLICIFI